MRDLLGDLRSVAERSPGRIVVVDPDGTTTEASELLARVEARVTDLTNRLPRGSHVLLEGEGDVRFFAWALATLISGRVLVPANGAWPGVYQNQLLDELQAVDPQAVRVSSLASPQCGTLRADPRPPAGSDPALVLFTSGASGRPKGVLHSHQGLHSAESEEDPATLWDPRTRALTNGDQPALLRYTSPSSAVQVNHLVAIAAGWRVVCLQPLQWIDPEVLSRTVRTHPIRKLLMTPSLCDALLARTYGAESGWAGPLEELQLYGEAVTEDLVGRLVDRLPSELRLLDLYGQSEATRWLAERDLRSGEAWRARPGITLSVERGELILAGRKAGFLFQGYLGSRPHRTGEPLRTGDRAAGDAQSFRLRGRADRVVKVRGHRVDLSSVEHALGECAATACAVAHHDEGLIAFVQRPVGRSASQDECWAADLRAALLERLPEVEVPNRIEVLSSLPRAETGKVDRRSLASARVKAGGTADEVVTGVFRSLFPHASDLSDRSSFRDLGGHSLQLIEAVALLREAGLAGRISPARFLELDTLGAIRAELASARAGLPQERTPLPLGCWLPQRPSLRGFLSGPVQSLRSARAAHRIVVGTSFAVTLPEGLGDEDLERALRALVAAHPVLEARSKPRGGAVYPAYGAPHTVLQRAVRRPRMGWGLMRGTPLFQVLRIDPTLCKGFLHHAIGDHESCLILRRDLADLLSGRTLEPRPYHLLPRLDACLQALPWAPPETVVGRETAPRTRRVACVASIPASGEPALLKPAILHAIAMAARGPTEVAVATDARFARGLFDVDASDLVSYLSVTRAFEVCPTQRLESLRARLDSEEPRYYRASQWRGQPLRRQANRGAPSQAWPVDLTINWVPAGAPRKHEDKLVEVEPALGETTTPNVATVYCEHYAASGVLRLLVYAPVRSWCTRFLDALSRAGTKWSAE